ALRWARRHRGVLLGGIAGVAAAAVLLGGQLVTARRRTHETAVRAQVDRVLEQGQQALTRGDWTAAQQYYRAALETIEAEPSLANLAWNYAHRGFAEAELRQDEAAEADFTRAERALARIPYADGEWALRRARGRLRLEQGKLDAAEEDLRRAG